MDLVSKNILRIEEHKRQLGGGRNLENVQTILESFVKGKKKKIAGNVSLQCRNMGRGGVVGA